MKIPRPDTRVRALFDTICKYPNGLYWRDAKDAYDNAPPAYDNRHFGPRYYSSMEVGRQLKKFCNKEGKRGSYLYKLKPEWAEVVVKNPFYCMANNIDKGKLELVAGGSVKIPGGETLQHPVEKVIFVKEKPQQQFYPGDLVRVVGEINSAMIANGLNKGIYQVEKVEWMNDKFFVHISGAHGGWYEDHFQIYACGPGRDGEEEKNRLNVNPFADFAKRLEKYKVTGSPEIRDMAWGSTHVCNAEAKGLEVENTSLKLRNATLKDELQTFSKELLETEKTVQKLREMISEAYNGIDNARDMLKDVLATPLESCVERLLDLDAQLSGVQAMTLDEDEYQHE